MTNFIKQHGTLVIAYSIALLIIVLCLDRCRCHPQPKPTATDTLLHRKSILDKEVKVLHDTRTIQVVKWRTQVVKGDSVFRYVYLLASDSCKPLLDSLNKQRLIEQNTANDVILTDSLTIAALDSLNKVNDILIGRYKGQIVLLQDTIKDLRKPRILKKIGIRLKHFGEDVVIVGVGVLSYKLINKLK